MENPLVSRYVFFFCFNCLLLECLAATKKNDVLYLQVVFIDQHFEPFLYFTVAIQVLHQVVLKSCKKILIFDAKYFFF